MSIKSIFLQLAFYLFVGVAVIYFATSPGYRFFPNNQALIKMSFKHSGEKIAECKRLTRDEMAKLPPNERRPTDCSRERHPLAIEVYVDGSKIYSKILAPSGVFSDGPAKVYYRYPVAIGKHTVLARMRDSGNQTEFDFEKTETVTLVPREILVIDFIPEEGGFVFK